MEQPQLKPGEKVIVLSILVRNAAILSGALTAALLTWFERGRVLPTMGYLLLGAVWGGIVGSGLVLFLFPSGSGEVVIAKAGSASLPFTLKAAFSGAFAGTFLANLFLILGTSARVHFLLVVSIAAAVSIFVGFVTGYLATK